MPSLGNPEKEKVVKEEGTLEFEVKQEPKGLQADHVNRL